MKSASSVEQKLFAAFVSLLFVLANSGCLGQESIKDLSEISLERIANLKVFSASKHLQNASLDYSRSL